MHRLFAEYPEALARGREIVERCSFDLSELQYQYPEEAIVPGLDPQQSLVKFAWEGAEGRYPEGVPDKVRKSLQDELELIRTMNYAPYFLTVYSIVRFARSKGILCQGRGSAANSAVCYCLGVTSIDPDTNDLLFERFISQERDEPPDIDVDFEHERREEVIQWIYETYGRSRAALCATVTRYRAKGALRDVGKALGLPEDMIGQLSSGVWGWSEGVSERQLRENNLNAADYRLKLTLELAHQLMGTPRHLGQHPGGFVLTRDRLDNLVPIEPARMDDRQVIEWDKDDIEALKFMKVDVLALGMLTCMAKAFALMRDHKGEERDLASIPAEDPRTYAMIRKADTLGTFQIESRAQMSMLPRLKPRTFYDLVIQVAIVRPGPIQGDMVHPYLRRREGKEPVEYPTPELEAVLSKTLGIPLFQESAMKVAMVCAGFSGGEADQLRKSMATFKFSGGVSKFKDKLVAGMVKNGYSEDFAERTFSQLEGFGSYGFPESHAASFALIAYASSWVKCHHPDAFCAALLNSQPMGFYAPAQIVSDARAHGVEMRPVCVNASRDGRCCPDRSGAGRRAVFLGRRSLAPIRCADGRAGQAGRSRCVPSIFGPPAPGRALGDQGPARRAAGALDRSRRTRDTAGLRGAGTRGFAACHEDRSRGRRGLLPYRLDAAPAPSFLLARGSPPETDCDMRRGYGSAGRPMADERRARARASAPGLSEGCNVHDAGRRNGDHQRRDLAESVRAPAAAGPFVFYVGDQWESSARGRRRASRRAATVRPIRGSRSAWRAGRSIPASARAWR